MPDETTETPDESQSEPEAQPTPTPTPEPSPQANTFDEDYVKELRSESAKYRKRAQEAEAQNKAHDQESMSEIEKAQTIATEATAKVTGLENQLTAERTRNSVTLEATRMDFRDPGDALSLIDVTTLTFDEETGRPTTKSVQGSLKTLVKDKPYLVKDSEGSPGSADGGATGGSGQLTEEEKIAGYEKELQERYGSVPIPVDI